MFYILGIDTGGTYTDGVLIETLSKKVWRKAKALTTKENLITGIDNCIESLGIKDVSEIELVCISTTLATNAVVEDRGCNTGLISLGKEVSEILPTQEYYFVNGLFNIQGKLECELDENGVREAFAHMKDKVDALVISGYASVRNPEHELRAKSIIRELSNISVVCAHEIAGNLGYYKRTVTALLNAGLIPIIEELIADIKHVLEKREILAPLMIVKGDGNFMTAKSAMEKPIDTILSGPAASIMGAMHLCDIKDATVIDIGGTTSDIALIENGSVNINHDGAVIGGWRTHVRAADIYTVGIGGDSRLRIGDHDELTFGPDKATPVSLFLNNENVEETLIRKTDDVINGNAGATSGFTPTDLAHVIGLCNQWNGKASSVAVDAIRYRLHDDRETCIDQIEKAFLGTIKSALDDSRKIKEGIPIIAIGAPSHAWMPRMEQKYNFTIMVPEHADVANAIGASVGRIEEIIEILIREDRITGKYIGFLGIKREEFLTLEEAKKTCVSEGKRIVKERAMEANCADYELLEDVEDVYLDSYGGEESFYIETRIRIVAAGRPDCINE